jgi:hypothetical protein
MTNANVVLQENFTKISVAESTTAARRKKSWRQIWLEEIIYTGEGQEISKCKVEQKTRNLVHHGEKN